MSKIKEKVCGIAWVLFVLVDKNLQATTFVIKSLPYHLFSVRESDQFLTNGQRHGKLLQLTLPGVQIKIIAHHGEVPVVPALGVVVHRIFHHLVFRLASDHALVHILVHGEVVHLGQVNSRHVLEVKNHTIPAVPLVFKAVTLSTAAYSLVLSILMQVTL